MDAALWSVWAVSLHDSPGPIKRIAAAKKISAKKVSVDAENGSASVDGSASIPYIVTLESCTCPDFIINKGPCKHMYRLAFELGVQPEPPKIDPKAAAAFDADVDAEIQRYFAAYKNGAISGEKFGKIADALKKGK